MLLLLLHCLLLVDHPATLQLQPHLNGHVHRLLAVQRALKRGTSVTTTDGLVQVECTAVHTPEMQAPDGQVPSPGTPSQHTSPVSGECFVRPM